MRLLKFETNFQKACEHAIGLTAQSGAHMVPSFHPDLLRGVSTYWWELFKAVPQLDVVYVPIGQGSGACAAIAAGRVVEAPVSTELADGFAMVVPRAERP